MLRNRRPRARRQDADTPEFSSWRARLLRARGKRRREFAGTEGKHEFAANIHAIFPLKYAEE